MSQQVSLCTVVANSEDCLPRFLRWALPRFAEIVCVRSRSQDSTDALLEAAAAAHPAQVKLLFREIDDIARQKQFCLEQATRPWRLVVDADEVVEDANWDAVVAGLTRAGIDLLLLPRYNLQRDAQHYTTVLYPDVQARLFNQRVSFSMEPQYQTHHKMEGARKGMTAKDVHIVHYGHIRPQAQLAWKSQWRRQFAETDYVEGKQLLAHDNWFSERNVALERSLAPLPDKARAFLRGLEVQKLSLDLGRWPSLWLVKGLQIEPPGKDGMITVNGVRGFLTPGDVAFVFNLAASLPVGGVYLEIGSWQGLSSILVAYGLLAQMNLRAQVWSVDTWQGSPEHQGMGILAEDGLYRTYLRNVEQSGVGALIAHRRGPSPVVAADWAGPALDLIFVDGDHSFAGCLADIRAWWPHRKPGGRMLGHDAWPGGGVEAALRAWCEETGCTFRIYPQTHYIWELFAPTEPT